MEIIANKAVSFVTKKADQITALIPRASVLERNGELARVLVYWGLDEWQILKNLGIKKVPHPILGKYKWPGVYTPFDHQRTTAEFLVTNPRCYVFNEQGTGKTSAAAWAADYLINEGRVKRVLVVCPVSIMDTAWLADLFRTTMHRTAGIAMGTKAQREKVIAGDYQFVIINFDGVKVVQEALLAGGFDLIIIDEANHVKTASTGRWKALASLTSPHVRVWAMTGTPAAQSPLDAYGLAKLVAPSSVPKFIGAWRDMTMLKITQYKWAPKRNAKDIVHRVLQPAVRFTKEECLDLPDQLIVTREVPLTPQQQTYYDRIKKDMVAQAAGEEITAANAAGLLNKLLQVSQGAVYTDTRDVVEFDMANRMEALLEIIEGTDHKVLVFIPYRHVLDTIRASLADRIVRLIGNDPVCNRVEVIHGGVAAGARADIIRRFQTQDDVKVLLMIPQATAHGITLTRANQVVWWGPIPSTETYLQANARAHRAGQVNKVTVTHLQGSPVERRAYLMLQNNVDQHMDLVELYKQEIA